MRTCTFVVMIDNNCLYANRQQCHASVCCVMTNKFRRFVVNIIFSKDSIVSNHDYVISNVENRPRESII